MKLLKELKEKEYFVFIDGSHLISNQTSGWGCLIYENNLKNFFVDEKDAVQTIKAVVEKIQEQEPIDKLYGEVPAIYLKDFEHFAMYQALQYMKNNKMNRFVVFSDLMQLESVFYHKNENELTAKNHVDMNLVFQRLLKESHPEIDKNQLRNFNEMEFNVFHIDRKTNSVADKLSKQYLIDYYLQARGSIDDIKIYKNKINYFHFHDFKDGLNSTMLKGSTKKVLNALEKEHLFFDLIPASDMKLDDLENLQEYIQKDNSLIDSSWKNLIKNEKYYLLISYQKEVKEFIELNYSNPFGHILAIGKKKIKEHKDFVFCIPEKEQSLFQFLIEQQNYLEETLDKQDLRNNFQTFVEKVNELFIFHQNLNLSRLNHFKKYKQDIEKSNFDSESPMNRYLFLLDKSRHSKKHIHILVGWTLFEIYNQKKVKITKEDKDIVIQSFDKHYDILKEYFNIKDDLKLEQEKKSIKKEYSQSVIQNYEDENDFKQQEVLFLKNILYNIFEEIGLDKNILEGKKKKTYLRI